jgi:3D (Asp-Asp-Asp) domain-containing protein
MKIIACLCLLFLFNSNLFSSMKFDYSEVAADELISPITLWATNYYLPQFIDGSGDLPLLNLNGVELGPKLSLHDWCHSALEGSVRIKFNDGTSKVFNYDGNSETSPVDCSSIVPFDLSKSKFRISNTEFGEGTNNYKLVPFRTIATDNLNIPTGSVLFIPDARGNKIQLENETIIHDGYFFAGDRGGAIKDNHIDVFTGVTRNCLYFPWIGHNASNSFKAYIVKDQKIINELKALHHK